MTLIHHIIFPYSAFQLLLLNLTQLQSMVFGIYSDPKDPSNLTESYTFRFTYPDHSISHALVQLESKSGEQILKTCDEIQNATKLMLRRLLALTESLQVRFPLMNNCHDFEKTFQ